MYRTLFLSYNSCQNQHIRNYIRVQSFIFFLRVNFALPGRLPTIEIKVISSKILAWDLNTDSKINFKHPFQGISQSLIFFPVLKMWTIKSIFTLHNQWTSATLYPVSQNMTKQCTTNLDKCDKFIIFSD